MDDHIKRFKRLIPQLSQFEKCGVPEMLLIENVLAEYQVTAFSTTGKLIVSGNPEYEQVDGDNFLQIKKEKFIYIALDEVHDHYHAITSLMAFLLQPYCCYFAKLLGTIQELTNATQFVILAGELPVVKRINKDPVFKTWNMRLSFRLLQ